MLLLPTRDTMLARGVMAGDRGCCAPCIRGVTGDNGVEVVGSLASEAISTGNGFGLTLRVEAAFVPEVSGEVDSLPTADCSAPAASSVALLEVYRRASRWRRRFRESTTA